MNATSTTFHLNATDQKQIFCYQWLPEDQSTLKGIVHIVHGLAEHAARYQRLAMTLNQAGYGVYAHDHRGHGQNVPSEDTPNLGFFAEQNGWQLVVEDLHIVQQEIKKKHPELPSIILAHSMGSLIAQQYLIEHSNDIQAIALSASLDNAGVLRNIGIIAAKFERLRIGKKGKSKLLNAMSFGDYNKAFKPNRTESDWLSRDNSEVDKYITDPYCGFIASTQLWLDLLGGLGDFTRRKQREKIRKDLPIYLLTGSKDPVTRDSKAVLGLEKEYRSIGLQNVVVKIYPDGRHESFNETNRDEVTNDFIGWINSIIKE